MLYPHLARLSILGDRPKAKRKLLRLVLTCLIFVFAGTAGQAQTGTNYSIYANVIYHFTKYVDWPDDRKYGDFVIAIIGDSPLYDQLKSSTANKMAGNQRIVVLKYQSLPSNISCHILFISEEKSFSLKKISEATAGNSILIVSEKEGMAQRGACINLVIVDDHLKLEINRNMIEKRELNIANELLKLGTLVK
ncbi:MAG: YfiR family protein [Gemmatimonadaceae bacterium]|nr:YfiR family protein [Chitinophagaceae bacterium]